MQTKQAQITDVDEAGFTAVASTGSVDRDGERIVPGAFAPLPASIPVHLGHDTQANNVIARAVPFYRGDKLMIDARFGTGSKARQARRDMQSGLLDSVSVVFHNAQKKSTNGVPTITSAELLACDVVSIPSNRDARVLSVRSWSGRQPSTTDARTEALLALAEAEIATAKAVLSASPRTEHGRHVRSFLRTLSD